jgi:hypothetical protein
MKMVVAVCAALPAATLAVLPEAAAAPAESPTARKVEVAGTICRALLLGVEPPDCALERAPLLPLPADRLPRLLRAMLGLAAACLGVMLLLVLVLLERLREGLLGLDAPRTGSRCCAWPAPACC